MTGGRAGGLVDEWGAVTGERFELGEGARFVNGAVVFVDLLQGRLLRANLDGTDPEQLLKVEGPLGAVAPCDKGLPMPGDGLEPPATYVAAVDTGVALVRDRDVAAITQLADPAGPSVRVNDAVTDAWGRFWVGTMAWDNTPGAGSLYRVEADGTTSVAVTGLTIPNGPAFSPDSTSMYLADTARSTIFEYVVDSSGGLCSEGSVFASVDGSPDGMTVDVNGCLWVAIWGSSCLHRYAPSGELLEVIPLPVQQPTSVALASELPYVAVVTSATYGLAEVSADDGRVIVAPVNVAGSRLPVFGPGSRSATPRSPGHRHQGRLHDGDESEPPDRQGTALTR